MVTEDMHTSKGLLLGGLCMMAPDGALNEQLVAGPAVLKVRLAPPDANPVSPVPLARQGVLTPALTPFITFEFGRIFFDALNRDGIQLELESRGAMRTPSGRASKRAPT